MIAMNLLARVPNRAGFDLGGYPGYRELPIPLRDKMLDQLSVWRRQEDKR